MTSLYNNITNYTSLAIVFKHTHKKHLTRTCKHDVYMISTLRTQAVASHVSYPSNTITSVVHKRVFLCEVCCFTAYNLQLRDHLHRQAVADALSRGELGRFWKYSNFRHRLILLLFWRAPVACYGEAAIVKTASHVCA